MITIFGDFRQFSAEKLAFFLKNLIIQGDQISLWNNRPKCNPKFIHNFSVGKKLPKIWNYICNLKNLKENYRPIWSPLKYSS
jgi:hypothetical protein